MKIGLPLIYETKNYIYSKTFYEKVFNSPRVKEMFQSRSLFVTFNTKALDVQVDKICGVVTYYNLKDGIVVLEILETPVGKIVESLQDFSEFKLVPIGIGLTRIDKATGKSRVIPRDYELFKFDLRLK